MSDPEWIDKMICHLPAGVIPHAGAMVPTGDLLKKNRCFELRYDIISRSRRMKFKDIGIEFS